MPRRLWQSLAIAGLPCVAACAAGGPKLLPPVAVHAVQRPPQPLPGPAADSDATREEQRALRARVVAADKLAAAGEFEAAKQIYKRILVGHPDRVEVLVRLGNTHLQLGESWDAVTVFEAAHLLGDDGERLLSTISELWVELGEYDSALDFNAKALHHGAQPSSVLLRRAQIQFLAGDVAAAGQELDRFEGTSPAPSQLAAAAKLRGYIALRTGDSATASLHFQAALELGARDPDLLTAVGKHFYDTGDFSRAATFFHQRVALGPDATVEQYLVLSLAKAGHLEEARTALAKFEQEHPNAHALPTLHYVVSEKR